MNKKIRILIVDDGDRMSHTLADILSLKGYSPTAVHSGEDALEKIQQISFDCVLTDIRMPEMDGVELFMEIQKRQPEVPVILMTAYASETLVQQGLEASATGLMQKPLIKNDYSYQNVLLANSDGQLLLSSDSNIVNLDADEILFVEQSITSGEPQFGDFYRNPTLNQVFFEYLKPNPG